MMPQLPTRISVFLSAVEGTWRNALYIDCRKPDCPHSHACSGVLFAADEDGAPILFPGEEFQRQSGQRIDKFECQGTLERTAFEAAFHCFINWHTETDGGCALRQLLAAQPYPLAPT